MYSELLQEEAEDAGVKQFIPDLEKIRAGGKHLLALLNGVLDLSKIEAGKMDLYLETFDVGTMVGDVADTVQALVQKRENRLDVRCAAGLGSMHADLTKVRQVLFNLVSNACKYRPQVQRLIADMHGDHRLPPPQVFFINEKRLARQQVHRDRVARKRVQNQYIKLL